MRLTDYVQVTLQGIASFNRARSAYFSISHSFENRIGEYHPSTAFKTGIILPSSALRGIFRGSSLFKLPKWQVPQKYLIRGGVKCLTEHSVGHCYGDVNTAANPAVILKEGSKDSSGTEDFFDLTTTFKYNGNYYRFEKVTYQEKIDIQHGKVWSCDAHHILFGYTEQSTTIDGVHYSTRSKRTGSWNYQGIMSISDFKDGFPVQYGVVAGYMTLKNGLEDYFNKETVFTNTSTNVNVNEGYQVRCIKE